MFKRLTCLVSCVVVLALVGGASADLVGHWRLDDGSGTVAVDSSGNGHDGALIGNPQWGEGLYNGGLQFAGAPDKVDIPYSEQLNPEDAFSVSLWANVDPTGSSHRSPITARDDYPQRGYIIYCEPGNTWQFWTGSAAGAWNTVAGSAVALGEWTHLAITYSSGEKKLYINGELDAQGSDTMATNTAQVLRIGAGATEGDGAYFFVGLIDDVAVFNHTLTDTEVRAAMAGIGGAELAANPSPEDAGIDVPRDVVLGWEAGEFAATHDVYLGMVFDDVNDASRADPMDVLVAQGQTAAAYDIEGVFAYGQTYYWRIDEVNGAPDNTVFKGETWSFTVEPLAYPIANVTASSDVAAVSNFGAENMTNGSGLNENDEHSTASGDMWQVFPPAGDMPIIEFEFDGVYKLHEMLVWNYNAQFELLLGFGIKGATVEYSTDGVDWAVLGDVELAQATGFSDYMANSIVDLGGVAARYVRLTVTSGHGTMGQYGLSEVRFLSVPVQAREPQPEDGAVDISAAVLSWRAGREAVSSEVYLSTDPNALELTDTTSATTVDPGALDLATTYYWRIDEVNNAEAISTWEGATWSFSTEAFIVVEDFESYTDDEGSRIYETWIDGYEIDGNGSTVGHLDAPFAEQTIVHNGSQSMPLFYDNSGTTISEAEFALNQDWTTNGIKSFSLYFQGAAGNSGQLYVKINGVKVLYDGDATDLSETMWLPWNIELSAVGGNLSGVTALIIGVEGAGASGVVYVDDVRLYPLAPEFVVPVEPDEANLVGYYPFDSDFSDSVGGHHGTAMGDAHIASDLARGQVLSLDGGDDAVEIAYSAELNSEAFTASLWVNPDPAGAGHRSPITSRDDSPARGYIMYLEPGNAWQFWIGADAGWNTITGPAAALGEWTHLAGAFGDEVQSFYVNGRLVAQGTTLLGPNIAQPLRIGAGATEGPGDFFFQGMLDETRIYDRALSAEEIAGLAGRTGLLHKAF